MFLCKHTTQQPIGYFISARLLLRLMKYRVTKKYALRHLLQVSRDNSGQQQTPTDTKQHQQAFPGTQKGCLRMCGGLCWHQRAFAGIRWCLLASFTVLRCLLMWEGCLRSFSKGIWVLFMDEFKVRLRIREYRSVQVFYGETNALHWKRFGRQNFAHQTFLKH